MRLARFGAIRINIRETAFMDLNLIKMNQSKAVGVIQLVGVFLVTLILTWYLLVGGDFNFRLVAMFAFVFLLGLAAGISAIKERKDLWFLTVFNLLLQVATFNVEGLMFRYSTVGGVYLQAYWGEDGGVGFFGEFSPGFTASLDSVLSINFIGINLVPVLLLIIFIQTLLGVKGEE